MPGHGRISGPISYVAVAAATALLVLTAFSITAGQSAWGGQRAVSALSGEAVTCTHAQEGSGAVTRRAQAVLDGGVQYLHVDAASGRLDPNHLTAAAGTPLVVRVSSGSGCTQVIRFDGLDARAVTGRDGVTIEVPRLGPGSYPLRCRFGRVAGVLVAE